MDELDELNLPDGYSVRKKTFRYIYNQEGKLVLALPIEECTQEKIDQIINQIKAAEPIT